MKYIIKTERLGLRNWTNKDLLPMSALNADHRVMEYFPSIQNASKTSQFIKRMQDHFNNHGYCYFAVDKLETHEFIGFIGLCNQDFENNYTPFVDIGWRLSTKHWGNGYATEGARACLQYAWNHTDLTEIFCVFTKSNKPSENVATKLNFSLKEVFNHPLLSDYPTLQSCKLLSLKKPLGKG